ncbi:type II toxin-antitoxin system VapC family toxin [Nitrospirillum sp. BR 11752]|uniref:type II toxin-antitoxin system VapC family toxin n=1 Tax=Nitrospirillum sp. BR 11752 TaxID=3104293 RepID=UPI002EA9A908|nr:type II toxin-antitoxin system VapC family toxin [Nitrospirillum sp. BR 11752]
MRLLIDTHILIWWMSDDPALPVHVRAAIQDPASEVFVSAATIWEISIKRALGRLDFPLDDIQGELLKAGFKPLAIDIAHAARAGTLPAHHQDPFDRMLVAQAQLEGLTLVSVDAIIGRYAVPIFGRDEP